MARFNLVTALVALALVGCHRSSSGPIVPSPDPGPPTTTFRDGASEEAPKLGDMFDGLQEQISDLSQSDALTGEQKEVLKDSLSVANDYAKAFEPNHLNAGLTPALLAQAETNASQLLLQLRRFPEFIALAQVFQRLLHTHLIVVAESPKGHKADLRGAQTVPSWASLLSPRSWACVATWPVVFRPDVPTFETIPAQRIENATFLGWAY